MNSYTLIKSTLLMVFTGVSAVAQASTLNKAEVLLDGATSAAELSLNSASWIVFTQQVDTTTLSVGHHTVQLQVSDELDNAQQTLSLPLYVPELANYDLAGQSNVLVNSHMRRSTYFDQNTLQQEQAYGASADGAVWQVLSGTSQIYGLDYGYPELRFYTSDAYHAQNSGVSLPLYVSEDRLAGEPSISFISAEVNQQDLDEKTAFSNGPIQLVSFVSPNQYNSTNNSIDLFTRDWQSASSEISGATFAFIDADTDFIDDRYDLDLDNDGLSNEQELALGTDPRNADSDNDSVTDAVEVANAMDPLNAADVTGDLDDDGVNNLEELLLGTDVNNADSDNDGLSDGLELSYNLNPLNENDALLDLDGDGLSNIDEFNLGTQLDNSDSDGDGIDDGIEVALGLNPGDGTDADTDSDGDGLSDYQEYVLGTDINGIDTDGDGVSDGDEYAQGSDPLDEHSFIGEASTLLAFNDVNGDGVTDWLSYVVDDEQVSLSVVSGRTFASIADYSLAHTFDNASVVALEDRNGDGVNEIGVFGFDSSAIRYQLLVYAGGTGAKLGAWNWPYTVADAEFQALDDLTGDDTQEYAILGIHLVNGTRQLVVKDGATRGPYQTFKWPNLWSDPRVVTMSDVTADGIPEVALYGRHTRLDKGQLFVYDGANANTKLDVYNWNKLWANIQLIQMDDVDGDGTIDWGQFGQRKDDGRYQWVVKKGHDKRGVIRTFSWPADLVDVEPLLVEDRTGDGVREVAIAGISPATGKVFVRINDGRLANQRIANIAWPDNWEDIQVGEVGDLNNDGFSEFALLGYVPDSRKVQLIVKDGQSFAEYARYTWAGSWEDISLYSVDNNQDGQLDIVLSGINQLLQQRAYTVLNGSDLSEIASY